MKYLLYIVLLFIALPLSAQRIVNAGSGAADSSVFATNNRLADTSAAIRGDFPVTLYTADGTIDSVRNVQIGERLDFTFPNGRGLRIDTTSTKFKGASGTIAQISETGGLTGDFASGFGFGSVYFQPAYSSFYNEDGAGYYTIMEAYDGWLDFTQEFGSGSIAGKDMGAFWSPGTMRITASNAAKTSRFEIFYSDVADSSLTFYRQPLVGAADKELLRLDWLNQRAWLYDKKYYFPNATPSTTLNDTTVMAWRGTGGAAVPIGFLPYGGGSGGGGTDDQTAAEVPATNPWGGTDNTQAALDSAFANAGGGAGTTNLGHNLTSTTVEITSSTGTSTTIPAATTTNAGVLAAVDKVIIDNAVVTTGSYANPSWLTSLAWSKITSTPTTAAGYGITDAVTGSLTSGRIPYATGAATLGDGPLHVSGTSVGLNAAPASNAFLDLGANSSTSSQLKAGTFEIQSAGTNNGWLADNAYFNAGWKRRANGRANVIKYDNQEVQFRTAGNSTAGSAITWTVPLKIGAAGIGLGVAISETSNDFTGSVLYVNSARVGVNNISPSYSLDVGGTDALRTASGTTAQRPTVANGLIRYNTTTGGFDAGHSGGYRRFLDLPDATPTTGAVAIYNGTAWESKQLLSASVSTTVDASGDVTVTHGNTDATFQVTVEVTGTTLRHATVHTKDATTFKVRLFDAAGTALANGTAVTFDWILKDQ